MPGPIVRTTCGEAGQGPAAAALASEMAETWPSEVYGKILDVIARQRLAVVGG